MNLSGKPRVSESSGDYDAPSKMVKLVDSLMDHVPEKIYVGLQEIHLTDSTRLSKSRSQNKTSGKMRIGAANALYWPASLSGPARIEIFLDKTLSRLPPLFSKMEFFMELAIAEVLFHELGHHVHTQRKVRLRRMKEEAVAEAIAAKLLRRLINRKYKFLKPIIAVLNKGLDLRDKVMDLPKK